jgi:teichuronic acid biosynthesis glycosyltransferase TuaG
MGNIDLSIIIPTYNRAEYIVETLESILAQNYDGISQEILVIDDGSTDNTEQILKPYLDRIIYTKIPNSGRPAVPRNVGIKMAQGELIAFQDSDDLWVKDKLTTQLPQFTNPRIILCYGNAEIADGNAKGIGTLVIPTGSGKSGKIFDDLIITNFISTLTVIVRRSELLAVGGFDESMKLRGVEDYELWLRLSMRGEFAYIDQPLALYRRHEANISHSITSGQNEHLIAVYESLLHHPMALGGRALVHREIVRVLDARKNQGLLGQLRLQYQHLLWRTINRLARNK